MADDGMLNLFDSEASSFLDDLTGDDLNLEPSIDTTVLSLPSQQPVINSGIQQQTQNFSQISPGGAPLHHPTSTTQKLHHLDSYNTQYGPQMMQQQGMGMIPNHSSALMTSQMMPNQGMMNNQSTVLGSLPPHSPRMQNVRSPGMAGQMMSPQHPSHFSSPPPGSPRMPHPGAVYQQYSMHGATRMTHPQQPDILGQGGQWNEQQPQQLSPRATYMQPQMQQNYLAHHDYAMPRQRLTHFGNQSGQGYMQQRMPGTTRLAHIPATMTNNQPHAVSSIQNYQSAMNQGIQSNMTYDSYSIPGTGQHMQQHPGYRPSVNQQMNSGLQQQMTANKMQQQQYRYSQQQHQNQAAGTMSNAAPPLSHYPSPGPNIPAPYRPSYGGMRQSVPSPRPTTPQAQGNFNHSSLQQLEQMIPPQSGMQTFNSAAGSQIVTSLNHNTMTSGAPAKISPVSPPGTVSAVQHQIGAEIQQLKQQLQLIFQMPQTADTQQKMLDIQERLRTLQAQQQIQQRQQQPMQSVTTQPQGSSRMPLQTSQIGHIQSIVPQSTFQIVQSPQSGQANQLQQQATIQNQDGTSPLQNMIVTGDQSSKIDKKKRLSKSAKGQEKANQIIQEAILKAQAQGNSVPKVVDEPVVIPTTVDYVEETKDEEDGMVFSPKEKKPKAEKKPKVAKPKIQPKKIKPPATFIRNKKKRKRADSSDASDIEMTLPAGSPSEEDNIFKRRSSRNYNKRKKYLDAPDLGLSDEDENQNVDIEGVEGVATMQPAQFFQDNPSEEDAVVVEKILGMRMGKRKNKKTTTEAENEEHEDEEKEDEDEDEDEEMDVEEFFVKYKNFSYLHCEWKTVDELRDKRIHSKIKRYKMKRLQQNNYFAQIDEDDFFNSDYVEVDRVLTMSVTTDPVTEGPVTHYLVKWSSLPYEESTWELDQDVDNVKIEQYMKFKDPPSEEDQEFIERPTPSQWKKIENARTYKNDNRLREYQLEGVNWLQFSWYNSQNCILADEMGLGKTIQSITFLQEILDYGIRGPFLIIAPLSTIANWQREFETWTDMNVITYHGTSPSRTMIQEYEMYYKDDNGFRIQDVYKFSALITTYETILSDVEVLSQIDWRCCVIDEAHRLKNRNCKLLEGLRLLPLEHRVLLTGTPLQNNIDELFSLLNFLEPNRFKSSEVFASEFGELKTEAQVEKLKAILKPMMLRRLKEDVEKNLAPKEETIVEVELTNIQKKYYRAILERNFSFLSKGGTSSNLPSLMNTMMELRKCCNHPYLVNGAEEKLLEDVKQHHDPDKMFNLLVQSSGKLVLIDKLLPKLKAGNHKVLIFSQMIRVLDILEDYLLSKKYFYERLDGRIRGNIRQEAIDRFSKPDSDRFAFLLCTRAGGLGINLTAADTVIIYDSDWNPQNDLQAQARCHRIGQQRHVKVYRLICRNTYEREMFDRASLKLGLDKAVLQSMHNKEGAGQPNQLTKKEVEDLLKKGAYGALMEDETAGDKFCEEDIDQILERRTQIIHIESVGKGSTFAKASFASSANRSDIDVNDPNFWQKWAKKADIDVEAAKRKNNLIIEEPRQRKQTARYGNQDALKMSDIESSEDSDASSTATKKKRGRRKKRDEDFEAGDDLDDGAYTRQELFKVEKNLLVYGWGRFEDILAHARFKRRLGIHDVETIARALLMYSLQQYKGDEKIKSFIWDLVTPTEDGKEKELENHAGLSAPVPRGRKTKISKSLGKDAKCSKSGLDEEMAKRANIDPETILADEGYKKHLHRHANKVLLRVRLLYYLRQEVIGDQAAKVFQNVPVNEVDIPPPCPEQDPPMFWWDEEADKSLLVGVFKHGYEKYNLMRQDSALIFLSRCGPPDSKALLAEQNDEDDDQEDQVYKPRNSSRLFKDDIEDELSVDSPASTVPFKYQATDAVSNECGKLPWPGPSELNTRLRRIITGYQKNLKRQILENEKKARRMVRHERANAALHERQLQRLEQKQRWTRREEAEFYRVVSTFGVEYDRKTGIYTWDTFRSMAKLDKKWDETLTEYYMAFYHMCKRVCRRFKDEKEAQAPNNIYVEPISEERATRCLARIDLLSEIREEILWHPKLEERLKLCKASQEMPVWWLCGEHDKDLLIGAAKHGLSRTDYHILYDPRLCFRDVIKSQMTQAKLGSSYGFQVLSDGSHEQSTEKINMESDGAEVKSESTVKTEVKDKKDVEDVTEDRTELVKKESPQQEEQYKSETIKMEVTEDGTDETVKTENITIKKEEDEAMDEDPDMKRKVKEEDEECDARPMPTLLPELEGTQDSRPESRATACTEPGDLEKEPSMTDLSMQSVANSSLLWPKDRVIYMRLEQVCHCIRIGEWPVKKSSYNPYDSLSATPVGTPVPARSDTPEYAFVDTPDSSTPAFKVKHLVGEKDLIVHVSEGEGLKLTIHKKRGRKRKQDIEAERNMRLRALMGHGMVSSDGEHSESSLSAFVGFDTLNGKAGLDISNQSRDLESDSSIPLEEGEIRVKKKRGRKPKADKLAEQALAEALSNRRGGHPKYLHSPDIRVPVVNLEDGSRLSGEDAPLSRDLEEFLEEHPGYMVDMPQTEHSSEKRRRKKQRLDPTSLDLKHITGEENVSVINRNTGKKITGAKAPPLRHLVQWLKQNPEYDVDPKWAHIVKEKIDIPKNLKDRIRSPSERGRRSCTQQSLLSDLHYPSASSLTALSGLASSGLLGMGGLPKFPLSVPFGGLPSMGISSAMMGLSGFGFPVVSTANTETSESKSKKDSPRVKSDSPSSSAQAAFPFMFNPYLYNPLLAAQGLGGFSLPTGIPSSFAALAQAGLMNGSQESDNEETRKSDTEQEQAEDLSIKTTPKSSHKSEEAHDLSIKKHSKGKVKKHKEEKRKEESPKKTPDSVNAARKKIEKIAAALAAVKKSDKGNKSSVKTEQKNEICESLDETVVSDKTEDLETSNDCEVLNKIDSVPSPETENSKVMEEEHEISEESKSEESIVANTDV